MTLLSFLFNEHINHVYKLLQPDGSAAGDGGKVNEIGKLLRQKGKSWSLLLILFIGQRYDFTNIFDDYQRDCIYAIFIDISGRHHPWSSQKIFEHYQGKGIKLCSCDQNHRPSFFSR
jgi:hypothetical protein